MKFTSKHVKSISRVAVPNPLLKLILCFFIEMNEVKNLLQYDKYPNYPQFNLGQLHLSKIGVRRYAPVSHGRRKMAYWQNK